MNATIFEAIVQHCVSKGDWARFDDWIANESSFTYKEPLPGEPTLSDSLLKSILTMGRQEVYYTDGNFYKVLIFIEQNWGIISQGQKNEMLDVLSFLLANTTEYMITFCALELLSEFYNNEQSLFLIEELQESGSQQIRTLVPSAFASFINESGDAELKKRALRSLEHLQNDTFEVMSEEAKRALQRVSNRL